METVKFPASVPQQIWLAPSISKSSKLRMRNIVNNDMMKFSKQLGCLMLDLKRDTSSNSVKSRQRPAAAFVVETDREPGGRREVADVDGANNCRKAKQCNKEGPHSNLTKTMAQGALAYVELLPKFAQEGEGPPLWFSPTRSQRQRSQNAPLLLSLPGIFGTGLGLLAHQEALERLFELRCLHIPLKDRTPFEGLVSFVEDIVREEARLFPGRPIYIVGESFGGALGLAVASRNPQVDLVLILVNPATSFDNRGVQQILPVLQALPPQMFSGAPLMLGFLLRDSFASSAVASTASAQSLQQVYENFLDFVSELPKIADLLSKETLVWKLQMLDNSVNYVNSTLSDVEAEVLILASNKDQFLPSLQEARRLSQALPNCTYRQFEDGTHFLLLEGGFNLATVIKSTGLYRQQSAKDPVTNFVMPTEEEIRDLYESTRILRQFVSPVFFSTRDDGEVVVGLSKIPSKVPLVFVGYHSLLGLDMKILATELLRDRQLLIRGLVHPIMFSKAFLPEDSRKIEGDLSRLLGTVPVSGKNMYKLLANGDNVVLYPGSAREALRTKGEAQKLFWPEHSQFVKTAAKFGATIVPMCTVGEDEIVELLMDFDEISAIPVFGDRIVNLCKQLPPLRSDIDGEVAKQILHMPLLAPKIPGRLYLLFGRPIYTEERQEYFRDQKNVDATYQHVKRGLESGMEYLLKKRLEDPYRMFLPRIIYELSWEGRKQAPTFKP